MAGAGSSAEVMKSTVCELSAAGLMGLLPGYYQHLSCLLLNKAGRSLQLLPHECLWALHPVSSR